MPRTLIIAYGNPLRGDDSLGWHAAERLQAAIHDPDVEILSLHQLTPELMDPISRAARVFFIDAGEGPEPGALLERRIDPAAAQAASFTHHATPEALIAGARLLYGQAAEGRIFSVAGADFSISPDLSPAVAARMDELIAAVLRSIAQ
jgi:hydrogenase maturation protease